MIGKAYSTEHKQQQEGRPDPCKNTLHFLQQSYQTFLIRFIFLYICFWC
jgi:hypothetical protein